MTECIKGYGVSNDLAKGIMLTKLGRQQVHKGVVHLMHFPVLFPHFEKIFCCIVTGIEPARHFIGDA